jgi:hypothetical protein
MNLKLVAVAALFSLSAFAAEVDRRANHQQARINQGVQSGELNRPEAARLDRRQERIENEIARDRADGPGLTPAERAKIQRKENRLSRDIYRQKHDGQTR